WQATGLETVCPELSGKLYHITFDAHCNQTFSYPVDHVASGKAADVELQLPVLAHLIATHLQVLVPGSLLHRSDGGRVRHPGPGFTVKPQSRISGPRVISKLPPLCSCSSSANVTRSRIDWGICSQVPAGAALKRDNREWGRQVEAASSNSSSISSTCSLTSEAGRLSASATHLIE